MTVLMLHAALVMVSAQVVVMHWEPGFGECQACYAQVDQPLCVECAGKVVAEVDAATRAAEEEAAAYEAALARLQVGLCAES